jgi:hypothetical protein
MQSKYRRQITQEFNFMKQNSWKADSPSAGQEISPLSWIAMVYYRIYNISLLDALPSWMNLVHTLTPCYFKIRFNISLLVGKTRWNSTGNDFFILYLISACSVYL